MKRILVPRQEAWLQAVREQSTALAEALRRFPAEPADAATLHESLQRLDELFLLVVVGEFNAGKSVLINALLGQPVLEEGAIPTTTRISVLKYDESLRRRAVSDALEEIMAPVGFLEEINIVDTPGTNAIQRKHEAITRDFIPRADLVLFVTSADRPFTESERAFLESIRDWGKKVILIINKIDILDSPEDLKHVEAFVAESARNLLNVQPRIFSVAGRLAFRARTGMAGGDMDRSGFEALESYIFETLDQEERVRLKLLSPLGVAQRLAGKYLGIARSRLEILSKDRETIDQIERHLDVYRQDMEKGFELRLSDIDKVLHQFEARGHEFIDETVRLGRVVDLLNKERIKTRFEKEVVADAPEAIERRVHDAIDWLIASDLKQWQFVQEHLTRRATEHTERAAHALRGHFEYDRSRLIETVGRTSQRTLEEYDRAKEAARMAESVQGAVANTALLEVGAIGLGAVVTLVATSTAADITGILAAGVLATVGFLVLPQRRRSAKRELRQKISSLRTQLMGALHNQLRQELRRNLERIDGALAPYTRFVRSEQEAIAGIERSLETWISAAKRLQGEIEETQAA